MIRTWRSLGRSSWRRGRGRSRVARVSSSDIVRRRVVVHGDVQGVNFRNATAREASSRGVGGWVTNRADGAVEAVLEGPPDEVEAMVRFCSDGPRAASVERVEDSAEEPEGLSGFEAR